MLSDSQSAVGQPPPASKVNEDTVSDNSPRRFDAWLFLSRLVGPPGEVILGQLVLQGAAWGFYAALWRREFISVPLSASLQVAQYKPVVWACTLASTILASRSTFLFSWSVRQMIALRLQKDGMTFATFAWGTRLASGSPSRERREWNWIMLSLIVAALTGAQTSGWSTLLTPLFTSHDTRITAQELDLSNPLLERMFTSGAVDFCNLVSLSVSQTGSGFAALNGFLDFPTSLTFMDDAFNTPTAGILPLSFVDVNATPWFGNGSVSTLPGTLSAPSTGFHNGLAWTSTLYQQGFTAEVSCSFENLTSHTTPSLIIQTTNCTDDSSPSHVSMSSNCVVPEGSELGGTLLNFTSLDTFIGPGRGYIAMIACGGSNTNYSLIFHGSGLYEFMQTTVCSVTPRIPTVKVGYTYDISNDFARTIDTMAFPGGISDIGGPASISAVTTIYNMMLFAQASSNNAVGDQLESVPIDDVMFMVEKEIYLGAVAELSGTEFRACLSVTNGTFVNGVPRNMSIPSSGILHTEFFGWEFSWTTGLTLIPGLLVAVATIYLGLCTVRDRVVNPRPDQPFNIDNSLNLLSASAAGGIDHVFAGTTEEDVKASRFYLGTFRGRKPVFVTEL
ncbi:hypothetical protein C8R45DRAFT_1192392 [Mycena sanguinolenta]|nr:hypothetical protein C8R45DRAFT_1192392 [Mycena sanguinolenta]